MTAAASPARKPLSVVLCSTVQGLREAVEKAFAASPLAGRYSLSLSDLPEAPGAPRRAEVLLADPGRVAPYLESIGGLRWMQSTWAGVDALAAVERRDFVVTRLSGCFGPQMSEFVLGALAAEDFLSMAQRQARKDWAPEPYKKRRRLSTMTMGILGVGDIASVVAQRAQAFGMRTLGYATRARDVAGFHRVSQDLPGLLRESDVVVSTLPSTLATRGLLDGGVLEACGQGKVFINVGRGTVVTEECLLQALERGWIRRAVLDVFETEPLPESSALWEHPAVQVTPHISAVTYPDMTADLFVENLGLFLEGQPLKYAMDLDCGY